MKNKRYRRLCKKEYLQYRASYNNIRDGITLKKYLRILYDNMIWEGRISAVKHFNPISFLHEYNSREKRPSIRSHKPNSVGSAPNY